MCPFGFRVLARTRIEAARPHNLSTRGCELAHRAARALNLPSNPFRVRNPTLLGLIALGIANHMVLTGNPSR